MRLALVVALFAVGLARADGLTAGAFQADITPPPGVPMAGYYHVRGAEGTHDPLRAKAIVFEQGGTRVALVGLDLIGTTFGMVADARKLIEAQTGIPGANVMISATHSHTGPVLSVGNPRDDAFGGDRTLAVQFMNELPAKIAGAVKEADARRKPAKLLHAVGREEGLAFNRRFHMTDGTVGWNPGKKNPKIVRAAGPTDDAVPLVVVEVDAKPIACYVNFAMHLDTVGGLHYSADYPHTLAKCVADAKGESVVTLFTIGTAGDINHINVESAAAQKGHTEAARIGTRLAAEVLRAWDHLQPTEGTLRATTEAIALALPEISAADVEAAKDVAAKIRADEKPAPKFMDQVKAFQTLDVQARLGKPLAVEVQVISLGRELAWVSLPGEVFVELGLAIKRGSPYRTTICAELANGSVGYIPTRTAYPQGNYEVVSSRCAAGSGEKLVDAALGQLRTHYAK